MKILQIDKFLRRQGGGATAYMINLAELQRDAGHAVEFFSMKDDRNIPARYENSFADHVDLEPMPPGVGSKLRAYANMLYSRNALQHIEDVLRDFRPDIAHIHNIYHQLSPSILRALRRHNVPVVMTAHDFKLVCPTYRMLDDNGPCEACIGGNFFNTAIRRCKNGSIVDSSLLGFETAVHRWTGAYNYVSAILCPSAFIEEKFRAANIHTGKLRHVPLFVDVQELRARQFKHFLFAGRLSGEKGVDTLVSAAQLHPDIPVVIAGDGPERSRLETLASAAPSSIAFVGHRDREQINALLDDACALVLPARYYENQPLSILEAYARGVAVIGTQLGGIPELVTNEVDGLLIPPNSDHDLAQAMKRLAGDAELAAKFGQNALARVHRDHDAQTHLERVHTVYNEVIERKRRP
jgi:glycosyltransferase involved in cell wall biosynthesis